MKYGIRHGLPVAVIWVIVVGCAVQPDEQTEPAVAVGIERRVNGRVVLGSDRLTAGMSGTGPLTLREIDSWLADSHNHKPLKFVLPINLRPASDRVFVPVDNPLTRAKIELGRQLFFDERLGDMSCANCHQPRYSFTSNQVFFDTGLNPLANFNRILSRKQFWDGKAATLEETPEFPLRNPFEMNTTPKKMVAAVKGIAGYRRQFEKIFGEVTFAAICKALACFQRVIVTGPSPYDLDRTVREFSQRQEKSFTPSESRERRRLEALAARHPFSESARRGAALFFSDRAGCADCHSGANFSDEDYHNLGVGWDRPDPGLGRYRVTKKEKDRGGFKTPSLRNVATTAPYMHDGSLDSLAKVVDFLNRGGKLNPHRSPQMRSLGLTNEEKADLVAFLKSLTGRLPEVEQKRLPE